VVPKVHNPYAATTNPVEIFAKENKRKKIINSPIYQMWIRKIWIVSRKRV